MGVKLLSLHPLLEVFFMFTKRIVLSAALLGLLAIQPALAQNKAAMIKAAS